MPKRALEPETEWFIRGLELEPKSKLQCNNNHTPLHLQQLNVKTLELLYKGANENVLINNNLVCSNENFTKSISQKDHNLVEKKPLKQMFIGNNLNLHANGEIQSHMLSKMCSICKTQKSEDHFSCNYCEFSQCSSCAMICSVCALPTCNSCSINSFRGHEGIFCLTCCR